MMHTAELLFRLNPCAPAYLGLCSLSFQKSEKCPTLRALDRIQLVVNRLRCYKLLPLPYHYYYYSCSVSLCDLVMSGGVETATMAELPTDRKLCSVTAQQCSDLLTPKVV